MSTFVPTPCIIPLLLPVFGGTRVITTVTKFEILCETDLSSVEMFYTIDGTKPQPYIGIVQGSKTIRYTEPFTLPAGKITVKALAINAYAKSMISNVITKTFNVKYVKPRPKKTEEEKSESRKEESQEIFSKDVEKTVEERTAEEEDEGNFDFNAVKTEEAVVDDVHDDIDSGEEAVTLDEGSENEFTEAEEPYQEFVNVPIASDVSYENLKNVQHQVVEDRGDENEFVTHCVQCELSLQQCLSCKKINSVLSRYCDLCGRMLHKVCTNCEEHNAAIANYCQFCGIKFELETGASEESLKKELKEHSKSKGVLAKPIYGDKETYMQLEMADKAVQTVTVYVPKKSEMEKKKLPISTPGRGYWRQQLDYVCNHLKAYASKNMEFRRSVGIPPLGRFISADAVETGGNLSVSIIFEVFQDADVNKSESDERIRRSYHASWHQKPHHWEPLL